MYARGKRNGCCSHTHYTLHVITDFFLRRIKSSVLTTTIVLHEKDVVLRRSYHNVKVFETKS